jgi:hypothetical protein
VFVNTYDAVGRRIQCDITPAEGIPGTTAQSSQYDGLSRRTFSRDTVDDANADVTTIYDSIGRTLEESQTYNGNTRNATNTAFTSYPVTGYTFPNDRETANAYDALYRRTTLDEISPAGNICEWDFFGPARLAEWRTANGLCCTMMNNDRSHSAVQSGVALPAWGSAPSQCLRWCGKKQRRSPTLGRSECSMRLLFLWEFPANSTDCLKSD